MLLRLGGRWLFDLFETISGSRTWAYIGFALMVAGLFIGGEYYRRWKIYKKIMKDKAKKEDVRGLDPLEDPISHAAFEEENPPTPTEALPLSQADQAWRGPGQDPPVKK